MTWKWIYNDTYLVRVGYNRFYLDLEISHVCAILPGDFETKPVKIKLK